MLFHRSLGSLFGVVLVCVACDGEMHSTAVPSGSHDGSALTDVDAGAPLGGDAALVDDADVAGDGGMAACPCFLGDGPYCGGRAAALAEERGCALPILEGHENHLLDAKRDTLPPPNPP